MGNLGGSFRGVRFTRRKSTFDEFDALPRPIRDALNYAVTDWSAAWCLAQLRKGAGISSIIAAIERGNDKVLTVTNETREAETLLSDLGL